MTFSVHTTLPSADRTAASTFFNALFARLSQTNDWLSFPIAEVPGSKKNQTHQRKQTLLHIRMNQRGIKITTKTRGDSFFIRRRKETD